MMLKDKRASQLSIKGCSSWAGLSGTTCGSTIDGMATIPNAFAEARQSWSLTGRTLSWRQEPRALRQATDRIPVVFAQVGDPVGAGFVESLARPGGNMTGFMVDEYGFGAKLLELLKEVAPGVTRVAVLRDLTIGIPFLAAIQAVAPAQG